MEILNVIRGVFSCICGLLRNIVHQIMDMEHISAGKNAGNRGFQTFVDGRSVGDGRHLYSKFGGKLIFRDQSDGKEKGITGNVFLRSGYGLSVFVHLCECDTFYPFLTVNINDGVAQLQRDTKILQALDDVSLQTAGIGHQFCNHLHLCALQRHAAGHDQADVAGTEDDDFLTRHEAFHIDQTLRSSC